MSDCSKVSIPKKTKVELLVTINLAKASKSKRQKCKNMFMRVKCGVYSYNHMLWL